VRPAARYIALERTLGTEDPDAGPGRVCAAFRTELKKPAAPGRTRRRSVSRSTLLNTEEYFPALGDFRFADPAARVFQPGSGGSRP
jgi:hypothetical protein